MVMSFRFVDIDCNGISGDFVLKGQEVYCRVHESMEDWQCSAMGSDYECDDCQGTCFCDWWFCPFNEEEM